ncbi:MAG: L,D-transpeptidase [Pseudonocardiales bacterium]|jgi:lipoprotein-anchoring transpeptidase ErfK/SrfK|nr:L,D-transpeptidase [Pseudonocardiales bacterium]MBV9649614.1 L,D-transpeptidase [Pseudonocardiales bacterium]
MAQRPPGSFSLRDRPYLIACAVGGVLLVVLAIVVVSFVGSSPATETGKAAPAVPHPAPPAVTIPPAALPADPTALPLSTTYTVINGAPLDLALEPTDGTVIHPQREIVVYATPGGPAIARLAPQQIGETWLPVIDKQPGWVEVLLPSRPNSSAGWVTDIALDRAVTPYLIRVHLRSLNMELFKGGQRLGSWTVGIGKESAPTPPGRTFLLGSFSDTAQRYSPVILPLGTHSPTLDSFGGGPGTVAIHTWPTANVFGTRSSDGCIRVPRDALNQLTQVPLGTLVLIDEN